MSLLSPSLRWSHLPPPDQRSEVINSNWLNTCITLPNWPNICDMLPNLWQLGWKTIKEGSWVFFLEKIYIKKDIIKSFAFSSSLEEWILLLYRSCLTLKTQIILKHFVLNSIRWVRVFTFGGVVVLSLYCITDPSFCMQFTFWAKSKIN